MCARTRNNEKQTLTISALFAGLFAVAGLMVGLFVDSMVIVFDGVYSLVSLLLTLLSLAASRFIMRPSCDRFTFGRAIFEPAVIAVKGAVILLVVGYSLYSAIVSLLTGGHEVDASVATVFGVVNVIGCAFVWWYVAAKNKRVSSGLIEAEASQWQMDTLLSVAVTAGFVIAWLLSLSPLASFAVYADPVMMLAISAFFIKVPFTMLMSAMRELFLMAPAEELRQTIDESVAAAVEESDQEIELSGVAKVGRELWVDVDFYPDSSDVIRVKDIEQTRETIREKLSDLPLKLQITVNIAG
ncbi:cation diffusion facilitator family transporter [Alteromonas sp. 1_MG-2023]|uniref:cation diffusion facilitator family transporter n=1 Tax=Alteromonas sp. 1_MG-2023 TaxID=3062669 RepID=UPI0026E1FAD2|nr:cation diffusion facilitator family transporter [Alteromonas sp. 1_MG-2023]MDO6474601.1 cation diffusion facilitator family transporter [Alteromonas sp. 1_MG-2023]